MKSSITYLSLLFFIVILLSSCDKHCIDIEKSDKYTNEIKSWKFDDNIGNRQLTDNNGISQTLILTSSDSVSYDESVWDNCNQSYGSYSASVQFNTSMSFINFYIMLNAGSYIEKENDEWPPFYIDFLVTATDNPENHKNVKYDLINKKVFEGDGNVEYLDSLDVNGKIYKSVLKVTFNWIFSDNDVKTLYYAKRYGIVRFTDEHGNVFSVVED